MQKKMLASKGQIFENERKALCDAYEQAKAGSRFLFAFLLSEDFELVIQLCQYTIIHLRCILPFEGLLQKYLDLK